MLGAAVFALALSGCRGDAPPVGASGTAPVGAPVAVPVRVETTIPPAVGSPYGVCAHISRGGEHPIAQRELALMKEAGIEWVRTDFDWAGVERKEGEWDFASLDETVAWAEAAGVQILPILDYDVKWASPAYKHLDKWITYVRQVVTRYKDRIRVWEVWNEQNLDGAWRDKPDAANYATLLKATYRTIKEIDPELTVLHGGLAGIPMDYIEGIYKAGGKDAFDAMNVHPYRYPGSPESQKLCEDLQKLRELMARYSDAAKPIWITEIGWPTHCPPAVIGPFLNSVVKAGFKAIRPEQAAWTVAVFDDPEYARPFTPELRAMATAMLAGCELKDVRLADLAGLDPTTTQALLMSPEEGFPADHFDAIEDFVRQGGTVILWAGVPLYYEVRRGADGTWARSSAAETYRERLHIGWEAWWTVKDRKIPEEVKGAEVAPEWKDSIVLPSKPMQSTRFFTDKALKPGDRFVPLVYGTDKTYKGVAAAAYTLNSDLKGGVIVMSYQQATNFTLPERQALVLPRAYLLALQAGVDRMFWYEFQAVEEDPFYNEHHFGIVHKDLSPKPAYTAMQVLSRARPAGSANFAGAWRLAEGVCRIGWLRPDGRKAWAVWRADGARLCRLTLRGAVAEAFDHLGTPVALDVRDGVAAVTLNDAVLYLVGPDDVTVEGVKDE
ncbi:MAG: hypothetical protein A3K19_31500 [Lentisphaerae bacterium RIFOXYB12_FULL_65_16]|nr:MAG: hypothetical protein A3K18_34395 [Lentisphaerae bacterium RIFOXYA12_64_32]OGV88570.1 MAG: hypothetical protein A3K19_31500 [Lentisphaerae bacterium RIFOXYB12_FULL_65_16]